MLSAYQQSTGPVLQFTVRIVVTDQGGVVAGSVNSWPLLCLRTVTMLWHSGAPAYCPLDFWGLTSFHTSKLVFLTQWHITEHLECEAQSYHLAARD